MRRRLAGWVMAVLAGFLPGIMLAAPADAPPDLASYRGKVVYVDFWASWCVPCRQSFPWMNAMHKQFAKDGLVVIAVNMDQKRADADSFLQQFPAEFTVRFDPEGRLAKGYKVRGMPTSVLLDRNGKQLMLHEGFRKQDRANLEAAIAAALH